jgi:hypothetical protein
VAAPCPVYLFRMNHANPLRAIAVEGCHYWPMRLLEGSDRAGLLLRPLASRELDGHEILLQLLLRRVPYWEKGFLASSYESFIITKDPSLRATLHKRKADPAYHVELRAAVFGAKPDLACETLSAWLRSWTSVNGNPWWSLEFVGQKSREKFYQAFGDHDMTRYAGRKVRRDVSGAEFAQVLPIPWRDHHPGLRCAGAPRATPSRELAIHTLGHPDGIQVGHVAGEPVRLPANWNHLAILGKTRSGKPTLAQNVVLQILAKQPNARVVILEPTGNLIRGIVDRLPLNVAEDTVEIDPSHPTFEHAEVELAVVPLNLLHLNGRRCVGTSELERRAERLSGDLIQAIKNAWGEQSVGGRADFILRTVIQGLLTLEGTNLVDAYSVLSDKEAVKRLERLSRGVLLKNALRHHLPPP